MRYVVLSVAVSMGFILILWMFSVYEGFKSARKGAASLPELTLPKAPTQNDGTSAVGGKKVPTGQDFFESEQTKKAAGSDAVAP